MNRLIITIVFLLLFNFGHSQIHFENYTSFKPVFLTLLNKIDSTFQLSKNEIFELRFWIRYDKTMKIQLFVLSLNQKKEWSARFFEKTYCGIDTLIEKPVDQTDLGKLWKELNTNKILTIPKDYDIRDKSGKEINLYPRHGISIICELLSDKIKRSYRYSAPKLHHEEYKYIDEYKWVLEITRAIFIYCEIPLTSIS